VAKNSLVTGCLFIWQHPGPDVDVFWDSWLVLAARYPISFPTTWGRLWFCGGLVQCRVLCKAVGCILLWLCARSLYPQPSQLAVGLFQGCGRCIGRDVLGQSWGLDMRPCSITCATEVFFVQQTCIQYMWTSWKTYVCALWTLHAMQATVK